jgi:hypothetical protein
VRRGALIGFALAAGCSFSGSGDNPGVVDAPIAPPTIDAPGVVDAPPGAPDMRQAPDAMPPPPLPDAMPVASCGPGYAPVTNGFPAGAIYRGVKQGAGWNEARADCQADGADLVVIDNTAEGQSVATLVSDPTSPYLWIGVFDPSGGGDNNWRDVRGDTSPFLDFGPQQPTGGGEDCVLLADGSPWDMWDYGCTASQYYVCECLP